MKGFTSFLEVLWSCSDGRREIGVARCRGPRSKTMEPNGLAIPTFPRTLGFSCSRVEPATGRTLPLALANAPVQFRSVLWVLQLRRSLHVLRRPPVCPTTAAGLALHVKPVSRCSRLDFRIDEGSSSCMAAPHLL
jgi:hypothetical protein